jgi:hypothetical protein
MKSTKSLSLGILATAGALVLELVLLFFIGKEIEINFSRTAIIFLFALSFIEESMKFLVIYESSQDLDSSKLAVKNAFFIGLGFSISELILKNLSFREDVFWENSAAFVFHFISSILFGFLLFKRKDASYFYLASVVFLMALLHLLFNLFVIYLLQ